MYRLPACLAAVALALAPACGDNPDDADGGSLECGPGTEEVNGQCLPTDRFDGGVADVTAPTTTASPSGGTTPVLPATVELTSDEPATIYYTTDGTTPTTASMSERDHLVIAPVTDGMTIQFFAVDTAGNVEAVKSEVYREDSTGPGAITGLAAAYTTQMDVTWANPTDADFAGMILVRRVGAPVEGTPAAGTAYAVDDGFGPGATVVYTGTGTAHLDAGATDGQVFYAAWAFDDLHNYGPAAHTNEIIPLGGQGGTIQIALGATPVVTVTQQPAGFTLSGTATYDAQTDTVVLTLAMQNDVGRLMFNPKLVIDAINEGTFFDPDGTIAAAPFRYYGPEALDTTMSASRSITITGVTGGTDPVVLDAHVQTDPMLLVGRRAHPLAELVDAGTEQPVGQIECDNVRYDFNCDLRGAVLSPNGRFLYGGSRGLPVVRVFDMVSLQNIGTLPLAPPFPAGKGGGGTSPYVGSVTSLALSADGLTLYAVMSTRCAGGSRWISDDADYTVDLVRISLTAPAIARVTLSTGPGTKGQALTLTPDGTRAAVALHGGSSYGEVALVDLATMQVIDIDPLTAGVQHIDVSAVNDSPKTVAFDAAGKLFVGFKNPGNVFASVDMTSYAVTSIASTDTSPGRTGHVVTAPSGDVWATGHAETAPLRVFGTSEQVVPLGIASAIGIAFHPNGATAYVVSENNADVSVVSVASPAEQGMLVLDFSSSKNHWAAVTPF